LEGGWTVALFIFPLRLMVKHLYIFEKQKINLFNNIFQYIYIYIYSDNIKLFYLTKVISIWICFSDICIKLFKPFLFFSEVILISEGVSLKDLVHLPLTLYHMWLILRVPPCQIQWNLDFGVIHFLLDWHERHHHHHVFPCMHHINECLFIHYPPIFHAFVRIT
jgi:hypothetical protein